VTTRALNYVLIALTILVSFAWYTLHADCLAIDSEIRGLSDGIQRRNRLLDKWTDDVAALSAQQLKAQEQREALLERVYAIEKEVERAR
jgi:hypothetical protein